MHVRHVQLGKGGDEECGSLELESVMAVSHHVGTGTEPGPLQDHRVF